MLRQLAEELRVRAATAAGAERDELLFLAAEYDVLANGRPMVDPSCEFTVLLPN